MSQLFNRDMLLKIGEDSIPLQFVDPLQPDKPQTILRATFSVSKTSNKDPNKASVRIYNLNSLHRMQLQFGAEIIATPETAWNWPLTIEAGYVGSRSLIFSGDIRFVDTRREGPDWVTDIEADDGGKDYTGARLNVAFGPGTTVQTILIECAKALNVGLGNSAAQFAAARFRKGFVNFRKGVVVTGLVSKTLDKYVTSAGYKWSIQDGQLQVLGPDEALLDIAIKLDSKSGLIGAPERGEKGSLRATSLLQGAIKPGRRVEMQTLDVIGPYKVIDVNHSGDTWGNDWYSSFEAKALQ